MTKSIKSLISEISINSTFSDPIVLHGEQDLQLPHILQVANHGNQVEIEPTNETKNRRRKILEQMSSQLKKGDPIYGVTSSYGGQAGTILSLTEQNNIYNRSKALTRSIVHVDVSTGPPIPTNITRAAILIRINMLLPGYSAVRLSTLKKLSALLNNNITPVVGFYGTLGASGDLAHNGRVLSTLLHNPHTQVTTSKSVTTAKKALTKANIKPLALEPKEGLGIVNGDNFSTAACLDQTYKTIHLMLLNLITSSMLIQSLKGSNRNFHPLLGNIRPHPGQIFSANALRNLLKGSQLAHQEMKQPKKRRKGVIIQDPYSIRCLPQYLGPDWEALLQIWNTLTINANSVSDNPLWTTPDTTTQGEDPYQWVSGGNFLAMHMSESLDRLRKILIHIIKQNDRHLARLINPHHNQGLPANLSDKRDISQCTFKGLQTQMGMYEVYASSLATPISTAFGIHEELNQDITSHAMTSALYNQEVIRLAQYALSTNLIAACQAIDLRGGPQLMSPATKPVYRWVRKYVSYINKPQPLGHFVEKISRHLDDHQLVQIIQKISY